MKQSYFFGFKLTIKELSHNLFQFQVMGSWKKYTGNVSSEVEKKEGATKIKVKPNARQTGVP